MTTHRPSQGRRDSSPLCLRVTDDERRLLEARARAGRHGSVSAYIRARLFGGAGGETGVEAVAGAGDADTVADGRTSAVERQRLLARILGALGESKALCNLSGLAEAARIGVLPLTPEVAGDIRAACRAVVELRELLIRALGIRAPKEAAHDR